MVGGLIGELLQGMLADSYSHASATGYIHIGGAVGSIGWGDPGYVQRCYSTGAVTLTPGGYSGGGLIGRLASGSATASYWDTQTSGMGSSAGGAGVQGLPTADLTYPGSLSQYTGWDFADVWRHDTASLQNQGYPYLAWQEVPAPDAVQNLAILADGDQIQLSWLASPQASYYRIYASDDPFAPLAQWTLLGQSSSTQYQTSGAGRRFFIVRAVAE
jgi:hypothetical protein